MRWTLVGACLGLALVGLMGCGWRQETPAPSPPDSYFPDYARRSELALRSYRLALAHQELLKWLPCYCNCATLQHTSLRDCYFHSDGSFEPHAADCGICQLEVIDAAQWRAEGKSLKQIRYLIDTKYAPYGNGTNTPALP